MDKKQDDRISRVEKLTLRMSVIQTAIAVTGFFVAVIALYAALNEADAVRKQQQASVWPHLEFHRSFRGVAGDERLDIVLRNSGIGPAKISLIEFFDEGAPLAGWEDVLNTFADRPDALYSHVGVLGRVIRPEHEFSIFTVNANELGSETVLALRDAIDSQRLTGRLCYCSVFDECWFLHSHEREPQRIKHCPKPKADNGF